MRRGGDKSTALSSLGSLRSLHQLEHKAETDLTFLINYRGRAACPLQLLKKVQCLVLPAPNCLSEVTASLCKRLTGCMIPICPRVKTQAAESGSYLRVFLSVMWKYATDSVTVIANLLHELWVTAWNSRTDLTLTGSLPSAENEGLRQSANVTY